MTSMRLRSDGGVFQRHASSGRCSSFSKLARSSSSARAIASISSIRCSSSSMRVEICSSFFISGCTFCVRIDSSSTSVTALRRRILQAAAQLPAFLLAQASRSRLLLKSSTFCSRRCSSVLEVVRHALQDLVLFEVLGERDLDGAVEGQIAGVDALQRFDDVAQGIIAFEDFAAEALAGDLDLLGERRFPRCGSSSGISPIWVRYIRTGSSMRRPSLPRPMKAEVEFGHSASVVGDVGEPRPASRSSASSSSISSMPCSSSSSNS